MYNNQKPHFIIKPAQQVHCFSSLHYPKELGSPELRLPRKANSIFMTEIMSREIFQDA